MNIEKTTDGWHFAQRQGDLFIEMEKTHGKAI